MNVTANLPEIYEQVIDDIKNSIDEPVTIECSMTPDECIINKKTYCYEFYRRNALYFTLPKIVMETSYDRRGYFIIDGIERFVMIQEIIRKNAFNVQESGVCTIKLPKAYRKIEINLRDCEFTINGMSLRNYMIGVPPMNDISIFEIIQYYFSMMDVDDSVRKICLLYLSLGDTQIRPVELTQEQVEPYFGRNFQRGHVIATLVYMAYLCTGCTIGRIPPTDLSDYKNKSFRSYPEMVNDAYHRIRGTQAINKKLNDTLVSSIKTGIFEIFGRRYDNMVTTVSRRSPLDAISSVRKIIVPTDENTKNKEMRLINPSNMMFVCPAETPEGRRVGLVKSLATSCVMSIAIKQEDLIRDIESIEAEHVKKTCVLVNGEMNFFKVTYEMLKGLKSKYKYLSVSKHHVLELRSDGGRLMRPVRGAMVDPTETGYEELDPSWVLGLSASLIPFSEHNQCARAVFASSMLKQAMTMMEHPPDHVDHKRLCYAQTPLVYTRVGKELGLMNNGIHMTVAIGTWLGFNQEDAIVMKKSFADRVGPLSKYIMNITIEIGVNDKFVRQTNESKYDSNGVMKIGQKVSADEPLAVLAVHTEGGHYQVKSHTWDKTEPGTVENVLYRTGFVKITMSVIRKINIGDKLASRHAQKGIVSMIVPEHDLPFDEDGNTPDIMINPHAIPSRMTIGQLIESQLEGKFTDGTIFNEKPELKDSMRNMYNPFTGELMKAQMHVGTVYYMFLSHQVKDKIHHRFYGENSIFSNQPVSGRSRHGGLRIGEMEMDMLLTHGASQLVNTVAKESDMTTALVCKQCGYILSSKPPCVLCNSEKFVTVNIPFAFKNMANVLQIAGIKINADF